MAGIHTHYDNLMVARNAPAEVIRASYLALSKKFHPDVNPSQEASRIMKIVNNSYDVLSDPQKRRFYDDQIREAELRMRSSEHSAEASSHSGASQQDAIKPNGLIRFFQRYPILGKLYIGLLHLVGFGLRNPRLAFGMIVLGFVWITSSSNKDSSPKTYSSSTNSNAEYIRSKRLEEKYRRESYQKPVSAPNGLSWPETSGYLNGYKKLNHKGKSTIQIENFQNDNEFYVKLVDSSTNKNVTVRHVLIKGGDEFVFKNVSPGKYRLMYMDLDSGNLTKSQDFEVQEIVEGNRVRVSAMKITLFKVAHGNFKSEGIGLDEFMDADTITENSPSPLDLSPNNMENVRI